MKPQFDEIFRLESLRGERIHWKINWIFYSVLALLCSSVYFLQGNQAGKYGLFLSVVNLAYNLGISWFVIKKKTFRWVRYVTMALNVLSLTLYIYWDAYFNSSIIPVSTAVLLLYPVVIFLGALRMDKYLILWTTFLCILSMDGLYFWFYKSFDPLIAKPLVSMDIPSQIYRTIYLAMSGFLVYSIPRSMKRVLKVQEQLAKESYMHQQTALHDILTGCYNRLYLEEHLNSCIKSAKTFKHKVALLFIDLNGFKSINDTYGHDIGDLVLKSITQDISGAIGENDTLARIGGDEFVVVMSPITETTDAEIMGNKIMTAIHPERVYGNIHLSVSASIGVALYPDDAPDMSSLIKRADETMYKVKKTGAEGILMH